jgi:uncharacterized membrane protein YbhN (UPF0104 family)
MGPARREGATISRFRIPPWMSVLAGIAILVTLCLQLGTGPIRDALRGVKVAPVVASLVITAGLTWCSARRWSLLADRLDVGVSMAAAFRAYYRAQFLNATLPTGMVGEVDRAVWHGHSNRSMSRGIRSVVWDRVTGQVVLAGLVLVSLPLIAPPVRTWMMWLLALAVLIAVLAYFIRPQLVRAIWADLREVPGASDIRLRVLVLSVLAIAGHVAVFVIAARSVGIDASTAELIPLGLVILQVSAIPLGIAGWGPREGGAALIFGAVGLGASTGLAVSIAYGVLTTLATLPGLLAMRRRTVTPPTNQPSGGASWASAPTQS